MKKITVLLMVSIFVLSFFGCSARDSETVSAFDENQPGVVLNINGSEKTMVAYNIKDNNYFKLRDIANVLKGTKAQFDVIWNESKGAIELVSGAEYSTDEELTSELLQNPVATSSYVPIYKDGATVLLAAYNIEGNNYFKLRDVASAIDFGVDWDSEKQIIMINTDEKYIYPTGNVFGLNTRYLSYLGKSKAEVDAMHTGQSYSFEFGMTTYDNDLMLGWGKLGEEPLDTDCAVSMYIPLSLLFDNCPAQLTSQQIKSQFNSSFDDYDMMYEENVICVNYCGKMLFFYPDSGLNSDSYAFINVYNDYPNPLIESIQIINTDASKSADTVESNVQNSNAYYDYAVAHDDEFWTINQNWMDEKKYYYLADVDHDGVDEMVVKIGAGIGVFKVVDGLVQPVFYDQLPDSSGRDQYWLVKHDNKYYIAYTSASSSDYCVLYKITDRELDKEIFSMIVGTDYQIESKSVTEAEYYAYKNSIEYIDGAIIDVLKNFKGNVVVSETSASPNILGYYYDDETGSNITILYEGGEYYIEPYIVRNFSTYTELIKIDEHTYKFYDLEGTDWVIEFDAGYETIKLDHVSTSQYRQPDPYWHFKKQI